MAEAISRQEASPSKKGGGQKCGGGIPGGKRVDGKDSLCKVEREGLGIGEQCGRICGDSL